MVLPRFVEAALEGRPLEVHGDGFQSRCFCDVRDVVPAIIRLLMDSAHHGRVFNIGSDRSITIGALAKTVRDRLSSKSEIKLVPYGPGLRDGLDDLRAREPDLARIREAIGFSPSIDLGTTIDDLARASTLGGLQR